MSLENTVASYQIQITRTGEGAAQAAAEFNEVEKAAQAAGSAARGLSEAGNTSRESLTKLRETSLLAREGFHGLNEVAILTGGSLGRELSDGLIAARMGLMSVRTAAMLTGASLEVVAPIVGLIALAAGAGVLAWNNYREELKKTEDQTKTTAKSLQDMSHVVQQIANLQKAGLATPAQSQSWLEAMGRRQVSLPANAVSTSPITNYAQIPIPLGASGALPSGVVGGVAQGPNVNFPSFGSLYPDALDKVKKDLQDLSGPEIEAIEKLRSLENDLTLAKLDGFEKERAAAKKTYDEQVAEINMLADIAAAKLPGGERNSALDSANQAYQAKLDAIREKENAKADEMEQHFLDQMFAYERQQEQELQQFIREDAAATTEQIKQFEDELTIKSLQSKDDRVTIAEQEYQARIDFYEQLYAFGQLTENKLTDYENQATKKRLQAEQQAARLHIMSIQEMEDAGTELFASGLSQAFVDFVNGSKSASQAFTEFAQSFLSQIAQMILQQEILNVIQKSGLLGGTAAADGGFFPTMAADGLDGVSSVSSPTYFPKFNVIAGEAGREMLTVLARPRFMEIGGIETVVGQAGRNTLAIANANQLARAAGGGAGGRLVVEIQHSASAEARIIESSVNGAEVRIVQRAQQASPVREAIKRASA